MNAINDNLNNSCAVKTDKYAYPDTMQLPLTQLRRYEKKAVEEFFKAYRPVVEAIVQDLCGRYDKRKAVLRIVKIPSDVYDYVINEWMPQVKPDDVWGYILLRMSRVPKKGVSANVSNVDWAIRQKRSGQMKFRQFVYTWVSNAIADMAMERAKFWHRTESVDRPVVGGDAASPRTYGEANEISMLAGAALISSARKRQLPVAERIEPDCSVEKLKDALKQLDELGLEESQREDLLIYFGLIQKIVREVLMQPRFNRHKSLVRELLSKPWITDRELAEKFKTSCSVVQSLRKGSDKCPGIERALRIALEKRRKAECENGILFETNTEREAFTKLFFAYLNEEQTWTSVIPKIMPKSICR